MMNLEDMTADQLEGRFESLSDDCDGIDPFTALMIYAHDLEMDPRDALRSDFMQSLLHASQSNFTHSFGSIEEMIEIHEMLPADYDSPTP